MEIKPGDILKMSTQGEWKVTDSSVGGLVMVDLFPYVVGCSEGTIARVTTEANAHLIASAPNLYAAIEMLMYDSSFPKLRPETRRVLLQARIKAEGK